MSASTDTKGRRAASSKQDFFEEGWSDERPYITPGVEFGI